MIRRPFPIRAWLLSGVIASALALGGCETDGTPTLIGGKAMRPLSDAMVAAIESKNMDKDSPILVRLFKQEAELEVWKQDRSGHFALLKTYPICRWSGELGPKIKEGDRQAPEGFYSITPAQMNPNSSYYLSFNLGYPNAFDKAWDRTGSQLMVHGDCSSRGCYAMTDEQIAEIYALGRDSFFGGQRAFQVQAYPFRMTPANMAKHRNNPNMPFWRQLKQGNDHFEVTRLEPKVDVCERRYVFNAQPRANASQPLRFDPKGRCPAYELPTEIAEAVHEKQRKDEFQIAELTRRNVPAAPIRTGTDGGMNPVFLAALNKTQEVREPDGTVRYVSSVSTSAGTIPATVNPPQVAQPEIPDSTLIVVADVPLPRAAPLRKEGTAPNNSFASKLSRLFSTGSVDSKARAQVASTEPSRWGGGLASMFSSRDRADEKPSESFTSKMGRWMGLRGADPAPVGAPAPSPRPRPVATRPAPSAADTAPAPAVERGAPKPVEHPQPQVAAAPATDLKPRAGLLPGAQPVVPTNSFDSRWGGL